MHKLSVLVVTALTTACSVSPDTANTVAETKQQASERTDHIDMAKDSQWLEYADAKADANIALAKGDTRLLAFANRVISFPGLNPEQFDSLKLQCGYRVLEGSGDMLVIGQDSSRLSELRRYAKTYNQVVHDACKLSKD